MTIKEIKKCIAEAIRNNESVAVMAPHDQYRLGQLQGLIFARDLLANLDKPEPEAAFPPQPKTLKVVIDGVNGRIRKWEKNGPMSLNCQIVELLISPVSGAKAEEPPAHSHDYKAAASPASGSQVAPGWTEVRIDGQGKQTIREVKFTPAEETLKTLPVFTQIKFNNNSDHPLYLALQHKDCFVGAILKNGTSVFFNPSFAYPDVTEVVYWRIIEDKQPMQSRQTMPTLNAPADTYRTLQPEHQKLFMTNPMRGSVYPSGMVRGSKVQVINSKGNILTGIAGDFHWSVFEGFSVVIYYRKL